MNDSQSLPGRCRREHQLFDELANGVTGLVPASPPSGGTACGGAMKRIAETLGHAVAGVDAAPAVLWIEDREALPVGVSPAWAAKAGSQNGGIAVVTARRVG